MQNQQMKSWQLFVLLLFVSLGVSLLMFRGLAVLWKTSFEMSYGMGPAVQGLVEQHRLGSFFPRYGWWAYALRMPFIPVAAALVYQISTRFFTFYLLKNLICWATWIYALLLLRRHYRIPDIWVLLVAVVVILLPFNANIASHADFEEGYLVAMLSLLLALLLIGRRTIHFIGIGVLVALIYLTKSSMALVCGVAVAWAAIAEWKRSPIRALLPATGLILAILAWGGYIYNTTGVFAFGTDQSSWNGWNYYKANNPRAVELYPRINLDTLDDDDGLMPSGAMRNEWEMSHTQIALGNRFIHDHPDMVLKMDAEKLYVFCCDLKEAPERTPGHSRLVVVFSNLVNHILLTFCMVLIGIRVRNHHLDRAEVLALLFLMAYMTPYFAGWVYTRHMVPVYDVFALVLAIQLTTWKAGVRTGDTAGLC